MLMSYNNWYLTWFFICSRKLFENTSVCIPVWKRFSKRLTFHRDWIGSNVFFLHYCSYVVETKISAKTALYVVFAIHKLYFYFPISVVFSCRSPLSGSFHFFFWQLCYYVVSFRRISYCRHHRTKDAPLQVSVYSNYTISLLSPGHSLLTLCNCVYGHNWSGCDLGNNEPNSTALSPFNVQCTRYVPEPVGMTSKRY